jgi:hypothetical protein
MLSVVVSTPSVEDASTSSKSKVKFKLDRQHLKHLVQHQIKPNNDSTSVEEVKEEQEPALENMMSGYLTELQQQTNSYATPIGVATHQSFIR